MTSKQSAKAEKITDQAVLETQLGIFGTLGAIPATMPFDSRFKDAGSIQIDNRSGNASITINFPPSDQSLPWWKRGSGIVFGSACKPSSDNNGFAFSRGFFRVGHLSRSIFARLSGEGWRMKRYFNISGKVNELTIPAQTGVVGFNLGAIPDGLMAPSGSMLLMTRGPDGNEPALTGRFWPGLNWFCGDPAWKQLITGSGSVLLGTEGSVDIKLIPPGGSTIIASSSQVAYSGGLSRSGTMRFRKAVLGPEEHVLNMTLTNRTNRPQFVVLQTGNKPSTPTPQSS